MAAVDRAESGRRQARRRLGLVAGGTVAVFGAAIAFGLWGPAAGKTPAQVAAGPTGPGSGPSAPASAPASVTDLPAPARVVNGVPVGYPRTVLGAVSAAAHYTQVRDLLSPSLVGQQLQVMAEPDAKVAGLLAYAEIVDSVNLRHSLGLDMDGVSDQADYVTVQPRAYQVVQQSTDQVEVWLLTWRTTVTGGVQQEHAAYTVPVALTWSANDWKVDDRKLPPAPQAADPDTVQAQIDGWIPLADQT